MNSANRGERLYQVRLYAEREGFLSPEYGLMRVRMVLGFIESKTTVIDAIVKTEESLDYLAVLCASPASPALFSRVMRDAVPKAIIEEISTRGAEEYLAKEAVRDPAMSQAIPFAGAVKTVNDSRRILLGLLLEYRALLAEYDLAAERAVPSCRGTHGGDCSLPFLFFELDGKICGLPAFQVLEMTRGGYDAKLLRLKKNYGEGILACSEVLCIKEIDVPSCAFTERRKRGYYGVRAPLKDGDFCFTLVVPSLI